MVTNPVINNGLEPVIGEERRGHLNKCEPSLEWYFYSHLDRKYATGSRTNHATVSGYWKATGKDRAIVRKGALVGMRKTLVFYRRRAPKGRKKTDWVMRKFRVDGSLNHSKNLHLLKVKYLLDEWLLCRVFHKNRDVGPKPGIGGEPSTLSPPPLMDPNLGSDPASTGQYEQVP